MTLAQVNKTRTIYLVIMVVLVLLFTGCLYSINYVYPKNESKEDKKKPSKLKTYGRFLIPFGTLLTFFAACVFVAKLIALGNHELLPQSRDQYSGIIFLFLAGFILTIMNFTVLKERSIKEYIKGKKFSVVGIFMAIGGSAIVFGFLDNFGMKLGTEALDDTFVQFFLGPFSTHKKFTPHKKSIQTNLSIINKWANGKWKSVINQILRCKEDIRELSISKKNKKRIQDLMQDIDEFIEEGAVPLVIPKGLSSSKDGRQDGGIREYVRNVKEKYDLIDGSKSMMGNTFSDFIGAILGAAIINLFVYMTSYDGINSGDDKIEGSFLVRNLNKLGPFMEAFFIALGCLIPIFLNIAITRDRNSNNNSKSWIVVGVVGIIMVIMMYLSVKGMKNMDQKDRKKSLKNTLTSLKDRLDIDDDNELSPKIDDFIKNIEN